MITTLGMGWLTLMLPCQSKDLNLLTLQARFISRPFVSLTQDARTAEETNNRGKTRPSYPHYKQRHFTAEIAEKDSRESTVRSRQ